MIRNRSTLSLAALAIATFTAGANADMVNIFSNPGNEGLGAFTGTLTLNPTGVNSANIIISITNTSPLANGGYITALAIWHVNNAGAGTAAFVSSSDPNFGGLAGPVNGSPFGDYEAGASTGGGWTGGGGPSAGLAVGESATFTFSLTGAGVGGMSAASFVTLNAGGWDLAVRFRGFEDGGSDKVTANPTPGAASLLALGGAMAFRRRR